MNIVLTYVITISIILSAYYLLLFIRNRKDKQRRTKQTTERIKLSTIQCKKDIEIFLIIQNTFFSGLTIIEADNIIFIGLKLSKSKGQKKNRKMIDRLQYRIIKYVPLGLKYVLYESGREKEYLHPEYIKILEQAILKTPIKEAE